MLKQRRVGCHLDLNRKLNIAHINVCTEAEGPYKRMAIWFQGCDILCDGCCNPDLQEIRPVHIMTVDEVLEIAIQSKKNNGIEGITFLGGEPTMQEGLAYLAECLSHEGLGRILFTGRIVDELNPLLVDIMDLIVDGMFDRNHIDDERNLVGSKNQRLIFVSDRYKESEKWFLTKRDKRVEINFSEMLFINGDVI